MAGSWIGGSANQLAMKEIFKTSDEEFSKVVAIDVFISNVRFVATPLRKSDARVHISNVRLVFRLLCKSDARAQGSF